MTPRRTRKDPRGPGFRLWPSPVTPAQAAAFSLLILVFVLASQGGRIPLIWNFSAAALLIVAVSILRRKPNPWILGHILAPGLAALLAWALISSARTPCPYGAFQSLTKICAAGAFGLLALSAWQPRHARLFRGIVLAVAAVQTACLLAARLLPGMTPFLIFPGNPQYATLWLCAGTFLAIGLALDPAFRSRQRLFLAVLAGTSALGVILVGSRSGLAALGFGGLLFWGRQAGARRLVLGALLVTAMGCLLPEELWRPWFKEHDPLAWRRSDIWHAALAGIAEKPFFGWGAGQFSVLYQNHALPQDTLPVRFGIGTPFAHNDYLQAAADFGIPAAVFLLWVVASYLGVHRPVNALGRGHQSALGAAAMISLLNFPFVLPVNGLLAGGLAGSEPLPPSPPAASQRPWVLWRWMLVGLFSLLALGNVVDGVSRAGRWMGYSAWAARLNPWNADALVHDADKRLHGNSAASARDVEEAQNRLETALRHCRSHASAWRDLAHLLLSHQRPPSPGESGRALQKALFWNPTHAPWWLERSHWLEKAGSHSEALDAARVALRLEPSYADAALQAGRLVRDSGRSAAAEKWLTGYLTRLERRPAPAAGSPYEQVILRRDLDAFRLEIGRAQVDQRRFRQALATLAPIQHLSPPGWLLKAEALRGLGRVREAEKILDEALRTYPDDPSLQTARPVQAPRDRRRPVRRRR